MDFPFKLFTKLKNNRSYKPIMIGDYEWERRC